MQAHNLHLQYPSIPRLRRDGVRTHDVLQVSLRDLEPPVNLELPISTRAESEPPRTPTDRELRFGLWHLLYGVSVLVVLIASGVRALLHLSSFHRRPRHK